MTMRRAACCCGQLARAALVAAVALARVSSAQELDQKRFDLFADPTIARCLAAFPDDPSRPPSATVTAKRGKLNDRLDIQLRNIKPGLAFDMFTVERSSLLPNGSADPNFGGSFGLAWYQSDLQANGLGHFKTTIKTILLDQIFGFDPDAALTPTNTFHVGFWFNDPNAANKNGCTFDITKPTPFNGEHKAGPVAMISVPDAQTNLGPLCTKPNNSGTCNP